MSLLPRCVTCDALMRGYGADAECDDCKNGIPVRDRASSAVWAVYPDEQLTEVRGDPLLNQADEQARAA